MLTEPKLKTYNENVYSFVPECFDEIISELQRTQASSSIQINDVPLDPEVGEPLFKAFSHQTFIQFLDLSNNFLQNEGCKLLCKNMSTLKHLKTLNLSGNGIFVEGLEHLVKCEFPELDELNLSDNPLGNESVKFFNRMGIVFPSLTKFNISNCDINDFFDYELSCFHKLQVLDLSFNLLSSESFKKVLVKLNANEIVKLNFNFISSTGSNKAIREFFSRGTCEQFREISLMNCNLIDADIYSIMESLKNASNLEILNLSGNSGLTEVGMQYITSKRPNIKKLYMSECNINLLSEIFSSSLVLPEFVQLSLKDESEEISRVTESWKRKCDFKGNVNIEYKTVTLNSHI